MKPPEPTKPQKSRARISTSAATVRSPEMIAPPPPGQEQIAARAYALWWEQGCPPGRELENWFEAERRLRDETVRDTDITRAAQRDEELDRVVEPPAPRS